MDKAPEVSSIATSHAIGVSTDATASIAPSGLSTWRSGAEEFDTIERVLARVRHLHQVDDPDITPHKSKYQARVIMTDVLSQLQSVLLTTSAPSERRWLTEQVGRVEYLNGVNHIEAEETSAGEKLLSKAMLKFKDNATQYPYDVIDGFNHLGIVWSNRTQHEVAHAYLQQAQAAFLRFKKFRQAALEQLTEEERRDIALADRKEQEQEELVDEPSSKESDAASAAPAAAEGKKWSLDPSGLGHRFLASVLWHELEVSHTLTLFFLAQVFGHLKKRDLAAIYCHMVLNRQLKQRKDFQRHDWVTNAIGLSFYYSGRKNFQQAHHCLLAAQSFVSDDDMPKKINTPTADTTRDQQLAADLCRAWGAFYLKWLQRSRDRYIESEAIPTPPTPTNTDATTAAATAATGSGQDELGPIDSSTSLTSLPPAEQAELKRLQRLDRDRERHFENVFEEEADEEEDELFGDLSKARVKKTPEQLEAEAKNPVDRTLPASLTTEEHQAVTEELKKNLEDDAAVIAATQESAPAATSTTSSSSSSAADATSSPAPATAATAPAAGPPSKADAAALFIEFKSLRLPPSPSCELATTFVAARTLFKSSLEWFTRAGRFYILDGYVSDHIPIQQDMSLLYKLLAVFDMDLSRQFKMHKRRVDLLTPIYKQLSVASYQEFFQQLTDELATTYSDMMELKQLMLAMKVRLLGGAFTQKKRDEAQAKVNELALHAIQFYQLWLQSWSKDGKEVETLDEYYHRWYLMAMFKIARCYSKVFHADPQVLNQFIKKALDQYKAVVAKALAWDAVHVMPEELALCQEMIQLLPHKMDRVVAKGGFRV